MCLSESICEHLNRLNHAEKGHVLRFTQCIQRKPYFKLKKKFYIRRFRNLNTSKVLQIDKTFYC